MKKAGVIGAAGFAGIQAVAILDSHPNFDLVKIASDANEGSKLQDVYPAFINSPAGELVFQMNDDISFFDLDVVFLAVPHKASLEITPKFLDRGVVVIDLSADFRLSDKQVYEKWYDTTHTHPDLLENRFFGLPELFPEDMVNAHKSYQDNKQVLVACAGCYVTATSLAAKPFVASGLFDDQSVVVADAISGFTGAGKNPGDKGLFVNATENACAYGVTHHRHTPEIEQILGTDVVFTPHLAPMSRGILSTVTMKVKKGVGLTSAKCHSCFAKFYEPSEFVKILSEGQFPQTTHVNGTNFAHIGCAFYEEKGVVVSVCAIDNLVKGAAGQAVQCANAVFGFSEVAGLNRISLPI